MNINLKVPLKVFYKGSKHQEIIETDIQFRRFMDNYDRMQVLRQIDIYGEYNNQFYTITENKND